MTQSIKDVGTLYQLRNKHDRRDVAKDTSKRYRACNTIVSDVLDEYIIAGAMTHFNMQDVKGEAVPPGLPNKSREIWFHEEVLCIVDKFILLWTDSQKDS